jgi:hypothetical protein
LDTVPAALLKVQTLADGTQIGCVFRRSVTARFGIVTAEFGSVTDHFGDVTGGRLVAA